ELGRKLDVLGYPANASQGLVLEPFPPNRGRSVSSRWRSSCGHGGDSFLDLGNVASGSSRSDEGTIPPCFLGGGDDVTANRSVRRDSCVVRRPDPPASRQPAGRRRQNSLVRTQVRHLVQRMP